MLLYFVPMEVILCFNRITRLILCIRHTKLRQLTVGLSQQVYRDMVFEILTDEQKHAAKYLYLLDMVPANKAAKG
jgi:hypothetical protein